MKKFIYLSCYNYFMENYLTKIILSKNNENIFRTPLKILFMLYLIFLKKSSVIN